MAIEERTERAAILAEGLAKRYGETVALDGLNLLVPRRSVFGILGPNGSGKTTAVSIFSTLLRADGGRAVVDGHDVARSPGLVREAISLTGQFAALDDRLTGRETLVLLGRLQALSGREARARAGELLGRFELAGVAGRLVGTYSGGMRRRLDLAASLVVARPIVFLDEPTTGLDPRSRLDLWAAIEQLSTHGTTVVLTTQYLEEADRLADTIAVIDHGRVIAQGTPAELKRQTGGQRLEIIPSDPADAEKVRAVLDPLTVEGSAAHQRDGRVIVPVSGESVELLWQATTALREAGLAVEDLALRQPTLDDAFLSLTGRAAVPAAEPAPARSPSEVR